jgi:hypothetical protein
LSAQSSFSDDQSVRGIAYSSSLGAGAKGRFVAVGYFGQISYSDDGGVEWTTVASSATDSPFDSKSILGVAYNGTQFFAVGAEGTIASSDNGENWTFVTKNGEGSPFDEKSILGVTSGGDIFVAVGSTGKAAYFGPHLNNTEGGPYDETASWRWITNDLFADAAGGSGSVDVTSIAFGSGVFVATSADGRIKMTDETKIKEYGNKWYAWGNGTNNDAISSSTTGITNIDNIIFDGTKFIAVGYGGKASTSTNGTTWTPVTTTGFTATESITAVISLSATQFLFAGEGKMAIITP